MFGIFSGLHKCLKAVYSCVRGFRKYFQVKWPNATENSFSIRSSGFQGILMDFNGSACALREVSGNLKEG